MTKWTAVIVADVVVGLSVIGYVIYTSWAILAGSVRTQNLAVFLFLVELCLAFMAIMGTLYALDFDWDQHHKNRLPRRERKQLRAEEARINLEVAIRKAEREAGIR